MNRSRLSTFRALFTAAVLTLTACQQSQVGPTATGGDEGARFEVVTRNGVHLIQPAADQSARARGLTPAGEINVVTIGPAGGVIGTDHGKLSVPAAALTTDVPILVQEQQGGMQFLFGPSGLHFLQPATLTVDVVALEGSGFDMSQLRIAGASDLGTDWRLIGGAYDPLTGTVSSSIDHFSQYALCLE